MSSNRISAADNEYTEGQVMLTGAKLCELIGPRSMAKTPLSAASRPDPGGLPAPGGSGRFCALRRGGRPMWAPYPLPLAPEPAASETPIPHAFWPSRPAAGKSAARGARMQRLLDQSAVACRARGAAFFWLLAGFPRGPMAPFPARGSRARRRAAPLLLQSPVVRLESYVTCAPARERAACRAFSSLFLMGIREVRAQSIEVIAPKTLTYLLTYTSGCMAAHWRGVRGVNIW